MIENDMNKDKDVYNIETIINFIKLIDPENKIFEDCSNYSNKLKKVSQINPENEIDNPQFTQFTGRSRGSQSNDI